MRLPLLLAPAARTLAALALAVPVLAVPALAQTAPAACTAEHAAMGHCTMPAAAPASAAAPDAAATGHPADVLFMQMMIPHHAQALVMTALVNTRTDDGPRHRALRTLAERIETGQAGEIALMSRWLTVRGQDPQAHAGMLMDGMLTPAQMADLEAARGDAFVHKFAAYMIQHHEGAIAMVDTLLASPGGAQRADVYKIATDIESDQRLDLMRLRAMRDSVPATPLVPANAAAPATPSPAPHPHHD